MSKSEDNFVRLQTLINEGINPLAYRYALLTTQYRSQLQFSYDALHAAEAALSSLAAYFLPRVALATTPDATYILSLETCLTDDLNTPKAIALLWELVHDQNVPESNKVATIAEFDRVLGLGLTERAEELKKAYLKKTIPLENLSVEARDLVTIREEARAKKDWKKADDLRDEIKKLGFIVKDSDTGPTIEST